MCSIHSQTGPDLFANDGGVIRRSRVLERSRGQRLVHANAAEGFANAAIDAGVPAHAVEDGRTLRIAA